MIHLRASIQNHQCCKRLTYSLTMNQEANVCKVDDTINDVPKEISALRLHREAWSSELPIRPQNAIRERTHPHATAIVVPILSSHPYVRSALRGSENKFRAARGTTTNTCSNDTTWMFLLEKAASFSTGHFQLPKPKQRLFQGAGPGRAHQLLICLRLLSFP